MRSTGAIKTFNTLLILLGFALLAISYPKLFLQTESNLVADSPSIGKILFTENDARLKKSFLFNWNNSSNGQELHNNDLLFTNENSQASFELSSGQQATIKSQTLLKIKDKALEVKNGEVELDFGGTNKELNIIVGGQQFTLSSKKKSKLKVTAGEGESRFTVSKGEVQIKAQNINLTAKEGEEVKAVALEATKADANIEIISPKDETFILGKNEFIQFKAENAPEAAKAKVTSLTSEKEYIIPLSKNVSIPPGEYEWSVTEKGESLSHPAEFDVVSKISSPTLSSPKDLEEIVFYESSTRVNFRWEGIDGSILQVTDEFQNLHFSEDVEGNQKSVEFFNESVYEWKVKSKTSRQESDWSDSRKVMIRKVDYSEGEPIVIELKRPNQLAEFSWENSPNESNFILSKTKDFKNVVYTRAVDGKSNVKVRIPDVGVYYWQVKTKEGKTTKTRPKKVLIRPVPPPSKPKAPPRLRLKLKPKSVKADFFNFFSNAYAQAFEEVVVSFDPIEDAKEYEIEIYSDQKLKRLVKSIKTEAPSFKWTPPRVGSYTWRIRFKDHWDRWSPYSDPADMAALVDSRFIQKRKVVKKKRPVKKKIVKKAPTKKSIKKIVRKQKPLPKNSIAAYYTPSTITFENTKTQKVEVEGEALGGHGLEYKMNSRYPWLVNYQSSYGEVFDGEEFAIRGIQAAITYPFGNYQIGISSLFKNVTNYNTADGTPKSDDGISSIGLGIYALAQIKIGGLNSLNFELSAHALELSQFAFSASYQFHLKKRFLVETKLRGELFEITTDDDEIKAQAFQAFIGPKYLF